MKKSILVALIAAITVMFVFANYGSSLADSGKSPQKITVTGKIDYSERYGGYYVQGENPPSQLFIVNPDKKALEKFRKEGNPVNIEGKLTVGADHLKIDKINGQKYP